MVSPPPSSRNAATRPRPRPREPTAGVAMIQSQASILVKVPPQQVYDFVVVGFTRNYRRWSPEVQRLDLLTPGPLRVGSRARQVRVDQGRRSDNTFRVVALEPPTKVRFNESSDKFRTEYRMDSCRRRDTSDLCLRIKALGAVHAAFRKAHPGGRAGRGRTGGPQHQGISRAGVVPTDEPQGLIMRKIPWISQ